MNNEILLLISVLLYFSAFLTLFKLFGKLGIYLWVILSTLFANIEVLLNIEAFGLDMTLGNVMFASTFLATDVISERYGKNSAKVAVRLGVSTTILYLIFSNFWLLFTPNTSDFAYDAFETLFSPLPRIVIVSAVVYYICQKFDIFVYHFVWNKTTKRTNDKTKYLWFRNNISTITTQLLNSFLFTFLAFAPISLGSIVIDGLIVDYITLYEMFLSSWLIMIAIAIIDTPFCYLCRGMNVNEVI